AEATGVAVIGLPEALEHERQERRLDAGTAIDDRNARPLVLARDAHADSPAAGRELDGVRQQVAEDLLHAIGVAEHARFDGAAFEAQGHPFLRSRGTRGVDRAAHGFAEVERRALEPELPARDTG